MLPNSPHHISSMRSQLTSVLAFLVFISTTQSLRYMGCFGPPTNLDFNTRNVFQSVGACRLRCKNSNLPVLGVTNGTDCLCGASVPPSRSIVGESWCDSRCPGFAVEMCGGRGFFSIYLVEKPEVSTQSAESIETDVAIPQVSAANSQLSLIGGSEL
ncbi:hypothetical protein F5Y06DRAFT_170413 [Hypoxylon sp. FL0890]|nr:hypothetical protein F5Y06DRAFT_170413 [Hypoxylon sp. FL0890]